MENGQESRGKVALFITCKVEFYVMLRECSNFADIMYGSGRHSLS